MGLSLLLFILWGIWVTRAEQQKAETPDKLAIPFLIVLALFAAGWTIGVGLDVGQQYFAAAYNLRNGHYQIVEGYVENFIPKVPGKKMSESFTVGQTPFIYSQFDLIGFHKVKLRGGPVDEGKYVRIFHADGLILKLWIRQQY